MPSPGCFQHYAACTATLAVYRESREVSKTQIRDKDSYCADDCLVVTHKVGRPSQLVQHARDNTSNYIHGVHKVPRSMHRMRKLSSGG